MHVLPLLLLLRNDKISLSVINILKYACNDFIFFVIVSFSLFLSLRSDSLIQKYIYIYVWKERKKKEKHKGNDYEADQKHFSYAL